MSIEASESDLPLIPKRKLEDAEMDITPMIDITFLLLIFFIVASKMDSPASGELPTAVANRPIMADKAIVLNIEKYGDGIKVTAPQQWDQIAKEFSGDMDALTIEVTEYVGQIVAVDEDKQVLLQASGLVKHRDISKIAQAVGKVGTDSSKSLYVAVKQVGQ
tara:strand:+ start:308 stop:793 length:486 start_codon:yes stop_codon:yes gene_type:complete